MQELDKLFEQFPDRKEEIINDAKQYLFTLFSYPILKNFLKYKTPQSLKTINLYDFCNIDDLDVNEKIYELTSELKEFNIGELNKQLYQYILSNYNNELEKLLQKAIQKYVEDNNISLEINEDIEEVNSAINSKELLEQNDKILDGTQILFDIDYMERDKAFIYIDGKVYFGEQYVTHNILLQKILDKLKIDNNLKPDIYRPDDTDVIELLKTSEIAYGSLINHIAFIEVVENCNIDNVVKGLKQFDDIKKVYSFDEQQRPNSIRLAKRYPYRVIYEYTLS